MRLGAQVYSRFTGGPAVRNKTLTTELPQGRIAAPANQGSHMTVGIGAICENGKAAVVATGKMVFTVLGAVAELERSLIAERVRAGLRNARAKGKRLGRPRLIVDAAQIADLRAQGRSWRKIARRLGIFR